MSKQPIPAAAPAKASAKLPPIAPIPPRTQLALQEGYVFHEVQQKTPLPQAMQQAGITPAQWAAAMVPLTKIFMRYETTDPNREAPLAFAIIHSFWQKHHRLPAFPAADLNAPAFPYAAGASAAFEALLKVNLPPILQTLRQKLQGYSGPYQGAQVLASHIGGTLVRAFGYMPSDFILALPERRPAQLQPNRIPAQGEASLAPLPVEMQGNVSDEQWRSALNPLAKALQAKGAAPFNDVGAAVLFLRGYWESRRKLPDWLHTKGALTEVQHFMVKDHVTASVANFLSLTNPSILPNELANMVVDAFQQMYGCFAQEFIVDAALLSRIASNPAPLVIPPHFPLHKAAAEGQTEAVRSLLQVWASGVIPAAPNNFCNVNPNHILPGHGTAISVAAQGGHVETLKLLLDSGQVRIPVQYLQAMLVSKLYQPAIQSLFEDYIARKTITLDSRDPQDGHNLLSTLVTQLPSTLPNLLAPAEQPRPKSAILQLRNQQINNAKVLALLGMDPFRDAGSMAIFKGAIASGDPAAETWIQEITAGLAKADGKENALQFWQDILKGERPAKLYAAGLDAKEYLPKLYKLLDGTPDKAVLDTLTNRQANEHKIPVQPVHIQLATLSLIAHEISALQAELKKPKVQAPALPAEEQRDAKRRREEAAPAAGVYIPAAAAINHPAAQAALAVAEREEKNNNGKRDKPSDYFSDTEVQRRGATKYQASRGAGRQ